MNKMERTVFYIEAILSLLILAGGIVQNDFEYIIAALLLFQTSIQMFIFKKVLEIGEFYE